LPTAEDEAHGTLGLALQAKSGAKLDAFDYVITGPGGFTRQGTIGVANSATLSGQVAGIPVGGGYSVTLSAVSTDGALSCNGSATFAIAARAVTAVRVQLRCREAAKTGGLLINGELNLCPRVDGVGAAPREVLVGSSLSLSGLASDSDSAPSPVTYQWTASSGTLSDAAAKDPLFTCTAAGDVSITLKVSDGDCDDALSTTVTCSAATGGGGVPRVVVNEVESSGGVPGDWVELYNAGDGSADLSGWKFKDNDDSHAFYVIPAGTTLAPGAFLILEESQFGFGLGGTDSARVWDAEGNPVDSYGWTGHAPATYGRCANGSGAFVATASTKGAANDCGSSGGSGGAGGTSSGGAGGTSSGGAAGASSGGGTSGSGGVSLQAWPGTADVVTVDEASFFGTNLSGLTYEPAVGSVPAVLWAVQNGPSKLYRLLNNGTSWVADTQNGWSTGKLLHYASGAGAPDAEGITKGEDLSAPVMYVATERDNNNNQVSRLVVLRVDTSSTAGDLVTTNEWNLTADLPVVGPNLGLEAIAFVPDAALVAGGFVDEATLAAYNPALYANHGGGLFFVGVEGNGNIYGYALDHVANTFTRVATIGSGQSGIMDLAWDREHGYFLGYCDNTCGNKTTLLRLGAGAFQIGRVFGPPTSLPASNNEGIAFAPGTECNAGQRAFFWSDDDQLGAHALRRGSIPCGSLF
jgi:Lamin Tail Domain